MLLIVILLVKLALFLVPFHYGQLAYVDHMALRSYEMMQTVHQHRLFLDLDFNHFITVDTPKYLVAGNSYPITYKLVWGEIPADGLELHLQATPSVRGLNTGVTFDELNQTIESTIVVSSLNGTELIPIKYSGILEAENETLTSELLTNDTIFVIPSDMKEKLVNDRLKNTLIALVSLIVAILVLIYIW